MKHQPLNSAVLWMLGGALCLFCAGLLYAVSAWDMAVTDRAYVDAAARAVRLERDGAAAQESAGMRLWVPNEGAMPTPRLWQQQGLLNQDLGERKAPSP